jgi:cbb3-type cytochrome oxidase subunit 3
MDINFIRALVTLVAMAAFLGVVWWAYAPSRRNAWERKGLLEADQPGERS